MVVAGAVALTACRWGAETVSAGARRAAHFGYRWGAKKQNKTKKQKQQNKVLINQVMHCNREKLKIWIINLHSCCSRHLPCQRHAHSWTSPPGAPCPSCPCSRDWHSPWSVHAPRQPRRLHRQTSGFQDRPAWWCWGWSGCRWHSRFRPAVSCTASFPWCLKFNKQINE